MRSQGWGPDLIGVVPLSEEKERLALSLSMQAQRKGHVETQKKTAIYEPGRDNLYQKPTLLTS